MDWKSLRAWIAFAFVGMLAPPAFGQAVWNGRSYSSRLCSNPNCAMCASIQAQLSSQSQVRQVQPVADVAGYTTEMRPVTRQVKRCNGRTCWYETVTEYVAVRVPIKAQTKPVSQPAKVDLETVTELAPTPQPVVLAMLAELRLSPTDKFFDLGCGDGRFLTTAAKYYGAQSFGIELNPRSAELARKNASQDFLTPLVTVFTGDVRDYDVSVADAVTLYLYPDLMAKVVPKLAPGTRVASYLHDIPGVETTAKRVGSDVFYVGVIK